MTRHDPKLIKLNCCIEKYRALSEELHLGYKDLWNDVFQFQWDIEWWIILASKCRFCEKKSISRLFHLENGILGFSGHNSLMNQSSELNKLLYSLERSTKKNYNLWKKFLWPLVKTIWKIVEIYFHLEGSGKEEGCTSGCTT